MLITLMESMYLMATYRNFRIKPPEYVLSTALADICYLVILHKEVIVIGADFITMSRIHVIQLLHAFYCS